MNLFQTLKTFIVTHAKQKYVLVEDDFKNFEYKLNTGAEALHGDISTNIAMLLAKKAGLAPRVIAHDLKELLVEAKEVLHWIQEVTIAGPGFLNIKLTPAAYQELLIQLYGEKRAFFASALGGEKKKVLIEFVSANPTGPLHLGHGRGGIVGDTLARVMAFVGYDVDKEFYINDAGNQVKLLGQSLQARCLQQLGVDAVMPEEGYAGEYIIDLATDCVAQHGDELKTKDVLFFELYAKEHLLKLIKADLVNYGITFDVWFSEKTLHDSGAVQQALQLLIDRDMAYEQDGALWFKSTNFGDDKDRVIRKSSGELTYIAADIAYHKHKFDRGYDVLIDILGHDHHGYVKRLQATMDALGYPAQNLHVILYQLVSIKENDVLVRMSKRAGKFTKLSDVIDEVGSDVARFFYLNRKTDMPLEFDLATALKKSDENPVFYIQYAFVRIASLLDKAHAEGFEAWVQALRTGAVTEAELAPLMAKFSADDAEILKKVCALQDILRTIATGYQTHLLSYYALELAQQLHAYYTRNKVIDTTQRDVAQLRMLVVFVVHQTLGLSLELLGLSQPERM